MKSLLHVLVYAVLCTAAHAQEFKKLPDFGDVTKEELQMTECAFDKGAAAMVIFNEAESVFRLNLNSPSKPFFVQTAYRVRIKVFNQKGFNNADITIRYPTSDKMVSITHLSAQTYNIDASGSVVITKVDKASVYDKKINSRYAEKSFAFPGVKEGSVLEYKYVMENVLDDEWYFQKRIPVQYSRFILDFPTELEMAVIPSCSLPLQRGRAADKGAGNYSWYAMEKVPGFSDEPFMSCREDYLQKIDTRLAAVTLFGEPRRSMLSTWPGIIRELVEDEDFGRQLKKDIPRTADLEKLLQGITDPFKKMVTIHNYVRDNMEWNGYDNIWALEGVKSAWKDKKGTSGEINLILINLLKDAGLSVYPILVSTKDNGLVNTSMPGYGQFDKVLAYVNIGDDVYVLDATDKYASATLVPLDVMASEGLLIAKIESFDWGWRTIWNPKNIFSRNVFINAEADSTGKLQGMATVTADGYERKKLLPKGKNSIGGLKDHYSTGASIKIDSINVENGETDTLPLIQYINFESTGSSTGGYNYFTLNLFTGLEKNPFLAEERVTDIIFSANQRYQINGVVFLPEGYAMEGLPKDIRMIMPDTSIVFSRQSAFNGGILNFRYTLEFKVPVFAKEIYPEFKEFYKKLFALLNEKFVYKKG